MDTFELFERLGLALAIGLLIGLERGWQARGEAEGERAAGLRTFALVSLLGGAWGAVALRINDGVGVMLGLAFLMVGGTTVLFRYRETSHDGTLGATTAVATLIAFSLGVLALLGDRAAAAAAAVVVAGLLSLKGVLHSWLRRMEWVELRSMLMLAAMSFILLPVLPNRTIDPLGAINPFEIWLLTVMIGIISFAGYVAIRLTGAQRGIAITGFAGGLASSTAVTLTLARLASTQPERSVLFAGGALLAGATMMARVCVIAAVVNASLLPRLALPLLAAAAVTAIASLVMIRRGERGAVADADFSPGNPLDLKAVLRFGALLALIGLLARTATRLAGSTGAYALAAFSGIGDVDAITLTMARLADTTMSVDAAALAVLIAVAVNTGAKALLAWITGGRAFGAAMAVVGVAALGAGAAAYVAGPLPIDRLLVALKP